MTKQNNDLDLSGTGAAYIRVSDDKQDTQRQYDGIHEFERRHGVSIAGPHWFKDEGWARDTADVRPNFQKLVRLAEERRVQWVVVDKLDRFGTKGSKQLIVYLYRLEEAGCRLYDVAGKDWTSADIPTVITAVVEGEKSKGEQIEKSHRTISGKVTKVKASEWQGGVPRLGFDVACYSRGTGEELWRVVYEGHNRRLKVWADGRTPERFDGEDNFPKHQPATEVLRVAPSRDKAKVEAAVSVFKRYATESIALSALAHHLNSLGFRTARGGAFQSEHIKDLLADPIFLGYYTWNRRRCGKFNRFTDGRITLELNYEEKQSRNAEGDWVQSERLFPPLVDRRTWDAVRRKLAKRERRTNAPRSPARYLAGLVHCGGCGGRMIAASVRRPRKDSHTGERYEYFCGSYFKAIREGWRTVSRGGTTVRISRDGDECHCLRNAVRQDVLEVYIGRYLDETGQRLELLTADLNADNLTANLERDELGCWEAFTAGLDRLAKYLIRYHPADYAAICAADRQEQEDLRGAIRQSEEEAAAKGKGKKSVKPRESLADGLAAAGLDAATAAAIDFDAGDIKNADNFAASCVAAYRARFDPALVAAEIAALEAEYDRRLDAWADLPASAKPRARERLDALTDRIDARRAEQQDAAKAVEASWREMVDLQKAVAEAKKSLTSTHGASMLRRRAEALRKVIHRIECTFEVTGGGGGRGSMLATVTIYPVAGDSVNYAADATAALQQSSALARRKRTAALQSSICAG
jgi:DNA invertase Pin-like site-specific DNA recombinase